MNPDDILAVLRSLAGTKVRVDGFDALNEMLRRQPHFTAQDGRREFVSGLYILAERSAVRLPVQGAGWDHLGQAPLPKWIQLVVAEKTSTDVWDHRTHPWHPRLGHLALLTRVARPEEVRRLNDWLQQMPPDEPFVPVKERSWEILGDEKRLESMASTALFRPDRLTWEALRCYVVSHIPPHRVYPSAGPMMMISENEAGFDSFCRVSEKFGAYRCVVLGNGLAIDKAIEFLGKAAADYGITSVCYFGDLDATGLAIGRRVTSALAEKYSLPVTPWIPGYTAMLEDVVPVTTAVLGDCAWLPLPLGAKAAAVLGAKKRIAQESIGWKQVQTMFPTRR